MKILPFTKSSLGSIGIELELQIVDNRSYGLISRAKEIIKNLDERICKNRIKPEITQGMIEINTSIHNTVHTAFDELIDLQKFLLEQAIQLNVSICGGGTHPFQMWAMQKVYPAKRYKKLAETYCYLTKRATFFGQHVHIGCTTGEDALYLTHALGRYLPQLIAISASSPFYQGITSGFFSTRVNMFNAFPTSGIIPFLNNWEEFSDYYYKMQSLGIIESMKDVYWDIRPKPEFGTVEVRIFDTPLTLKTAVIHAAYLQVLALCLLTERPSKLDHDLYYLYNYNRFQASRYGFDGMFIDPYSKEKILIKDDILQTLEKVQGYAEKTESRGYLEILKDKVINKKNDTTIIKEIQKQAGSLSQIVAELSRLWLTH